MAVVPRDQLTFALVVEQYYLALKGSGLMVSPLEMELIRGWEASGAPAWVVCAGIREAFEARTRKRGEGAQPPRSLRFCRKAVDTLISAWVNARVGQHPAPAASPTAPPTGSED